MFIWLIFVGLSSGMAYASDYTLARVGVQEGSLRTVVGNLKGLTNDQCGQLVGESTARYEELAKSLTVFTSKRDLAMLVFGSWFCLNAASSCVDKLAVGLGFKKDRVIDISDPEWRENYKKEGTFRYRDTTEQERPGYLTSAFWSGCWAALWGYMAKRGYQCAYGSVPVENARSIMELIKTQKSHLERA